MRIVWVFSCLPPSLWVPVEMVLRRKNRRFVRRFRMNVKDARFLVIDPDDGVCRHDLMILHPGQPVAHLFQHDRIEIPGRCNPANDGCLLPSSSERLVELYHRERFFQPDLSQNQLCLKQIAVSIQGVKLGVHTAAISHVGQT